MVPVLPFLFLGGGSAVLLAALLSALVLAVVGGTVAFLSGTSYVRTVGRTVGLAALAATITYAVGRAFGASIT
jgi:VIT1/CCC1 family predicted Fe2+/Mn2+ transporter